MIAPAPHPPRVVLVNTVLPAYRRTVLEQMTTAVEDLRAVAGESHFDPTLRTEVDLGAHRVVARNRYLAARRLLWQSGAIGPAVRADVAIFELNPRILSTWVGLLLRRATGRPSILWGHAWPRSGPGARTDGLRQAMRRLANGILVYTESEARELRRRMPHARIFAAPNALSHRRQMGPALDSTLPTDFVYVGRLVAAKKPLLLVRAFLAALDRLPTGSRLVIVGDGPVRDEVERVCAAAPAGSSVVVTGPIHDEAQLRERYNGAVASVSPGYAGLSLIQSLAHGVPMIIGREEPHAPEIEAAQEGLNCVFFPSDSEEELAQALIEMSEQRERWVPRRSEIARACAESYSVEAMVERVTAAIDAVDRGRTRTGTGAPARP